MHENYIHIIESPSANDMFSGDYEGHVLTQALRLIRIKSLYYLTVNEETFNKAIAQLNHEITTNKNVPLLHLSTHGNKDGIVLTDKTFISWDKLRGILEPVNDALKGNLCLSLASCRGFYGCRMAMVYPKLPFYALVGPIDEMPLTDMAIGFVSFYHNLFTKKKGGREAVEIMKIASGNPNFELILAQEARNLLIDHIVKMIFPQKKQGF